MSTRQPCWVLRILGKESPKIGSAFERAISRTSTWRLLDILFRLVPSFLGQFGSIWLKLDGKGFSSISIIYPCRHIPSICPKGHPWCPDPMNLLCFWRRPDCAPSNQITSCRCSQDILLRAHSKTCLQHHSLDLPERFCSLVWVPTPVGLSTEGSTCGNLGTISCTSRRFRNVR